MNVKAEERSGRFDAIKWILVGLAIAVGVAGNALYADESLLYRVLGLLLLAVVAMAIASQTVKGAALWSLIQGSRTEIRKVVWPSHQETLQTTAIVLVVVVIMALLLWGLDSLLSWAVAEIIG